MDKTKSRQRVWRPAVRKAAMATACLALAACASTQPRQYFGYGADNEAARSSKEAYLNLLAQRVELLACEARNAGYALRIEADQVPATVVNEASPSTAEKEKCPAAAAVDSTPSMHEIELKSAEFLDAGMTLTDLLCLDHFNRASSNQRHRGYGRSVLNDTGGLVSAIMGLTNAGSLATGIVGAGFSFAGSTAAGVENSYMVSVDLDSAQALVQKTMATLAAHYADNPPANYYAAERALVRYATTCTFGGIRALLAQSVRGTEPRINATDTEAVVEMTPNALSEEELELLQRYRALKAEDEE